MKAAPPIAGSAVRIRAAPWTASAATAQTSTVMNTWARWGSVGGSCSSRRALQPLKMPSPRSPHTRPERGAVQNDARSVIANVQTMAATATDTVIAAGGSPGRTVSTRLASSAAAKAAPVIPMAQRQSPNTSRSGAVAIATSNAVAMVVVAAGRGVIVASAGSRRGRSPPTSRC